VPAQRSDELVDHAAENLTLERIEKIYDRHVIGNFVVEDVGIHELDVLAAQRRDRAFDVCPGNLDEVGRELYADDFSKRIRCSLENHAAFTAAEIDEDVVFGDLACPQHAAEHPPGRRLVIHAIVAGEPDVGEPDNRGGLDSGRTFVDEIPDESLQICVCGPYGAKQGEERTASNSL
jgi:hypothetical protein